ncbi:dipeptidase 1-like [Musca autumnalis]|uniref:dipeptidase 1-like n=1 Tax=Musca autumnalis TaxID=221902 RepID=UPI003CF50F3A
MSDGDRSSVSLSDSSSAISNTVVKTWTEEEGMGPVRIQPNIVFWANMEPRMFLCVPSRKICGYKSAPNNKSTGRESKRRSSAKLILGNREVMFELRGHEGRLPEIFGRTNAQVSTIKEESKREPMRSEQFFFEVAYVELLTPETVAVIDWTTGFGGLPDVTEHSNIRRNNISRQNSTSNSDSGGEIASIQKSKVNFNDSKSPSDVSDPIVADAASAAAKAKRKSKASQQHGHGTMVGGGQHKLTGRNSCVIGLTLVVALSLLAVAATLLYQHFVMAPSRNSHTQRLKIVKRILRDVPLVDGHNNFAWNVRKYAHSSLELVHVSNDINHKSMWVRPAWAQTDMERLKMGQVGVQVWSAYVPCEAQGLDAVQLALEQIDIIRRLTDMYHQDTVLVQSSKDIQMAQRQGLISSLIGIEGGHAIGSSLGVLRSFYSLGARYLSLTHKCDVSWAGSSSTAIDAGLSQFGKAIIREMNRLGMMIDLSYSSDNTARDVLSATRAPVIFSHSGARQLCNSTRNVPDDILRLVAENGGLIMISFDSEDVACGRQSRLKDVVDHIKYIRSIAGIQHIGLGAGYDSIELPPIGLEDVSKYPDLLATLLEDPNWSEEDIAMLAGKNFLRIMETVENVRDYWKRAAIQPIEQTVAQPKSQCAYMAS